MRIALATCSRLPEPDPDQRPLLDALRSLGADAQMLAWDDPAADWDRLDLCVIRSTWNYHNQLPEFLAWARRTSRKTTLLNPLEIVRWNCDKRYLKELEASGIRTIPTEYYPRDGKRGLRKILAERGWTDVVIKPRVSASSFMTRRFNDGSMKSA
jgi:glutathione synthase/RimK-type ligase-like ATP-grasp enzyme